MANLTEEELAEIVRRAVRDETERCALLVTTRGDISRRSAEKLRRDGTYSTWALWPLFKTVSYVAPKWAKQAEMFDLVGEAFDKVAECIRKGYDERKISRDLNAGIKFPCTRCTEPMECGSWASCQHFGAWHK